MGKESVGIVNTAAADPNARPIIIQYQAAGFEKM